MSISPDTATLHWAIKNADEKEILQVLEEKNVDLKAIDKNGDSVLHMVFENKIMREKECVAYKESKNVALWKVQSREATEKIIINLLKAFLDRGIDLNIVNANKKTVLHLAVANRMKNVVEFLIEHNADINKIDEVGNSIAHYFVADENKKFKYAVAHFRDSYDGRDIENTSAKFVEWLIEKGLNFDRRNNKGESALHLAIRRNLQHILPTLLEHTKDIGFIDEEGRTLLHMIFENRRKYFFSYFSTCDDNWYWSYSSRYILSIVKTLIDRRVPVASNHRFGVTACLEAAYRAREKPFILEMIIYYMIDACSDKDMATKLFQMLISILIWWKYSDFLKILRAVVAKGADINEKDANGDAPIHCLSKGSCDGNTCSVIRFLVTEGCDIHAINNSGETPIHAAVSCDNIMSVRKLIECGADVNCKNKDQKIPLLKASSINETLAKELLEHGANINDPCILDHLSSNIRILGGKPQIVLVRRFLDTLFIEHWIKLKVANLPYSEKYDNFKFLMHLHYRQQKQKCMEEIEILKKTFIDSQSTSLYAWLHMNTSQRYIHNHNQKILNIVNSPTLKEQFPQYSTVILACYRETLAKKSLVDPAKKTWLELTGIALPHLCIERILDYLSKGDLIYMVKREENEV